MKTIMRIKGPFLSLGLLLVTLTSCEGRRVPATLEFPRSFSYTFDSNTGLSKTTVLTREQILGQIELPADAQVEHVDIQNVSLSLDAAPTNAATSATISFTYLGTNVATSVNVATADAATAPILANAVSTLRTNVEGMLKGDPSAPSQIAITSTISGIAPSGARLVLDAVLTVTMTLTYTDCIDIGMGPFGPGEPCTIIDP